MSANPTKPQRRVRTVVRRCDGSGRLPVLGDWMGGRWGKCVVCGHLVRMGPLQKRVARHMVEILPLTSDKRANL